MRKASTLENTNIKALHNFKRFPIPDRFLFDDNEKLLPITNQKNQRKY